MPSDDIPEVAEQHLEDREDEDRGADLAVQLSRIGRDISDIDRHIGFDQNEADNGEQHCERLEQAVELEPDRA